MDEFSNRMDAQRTVLKTVNRQPFFKEELCGLSRKAIERWLNANQIEPSGVVATTLIQISTKLFFLSTKSQEQVTDDYKLLSREVQSLGVKLNQIIAGSAAINRH
jgi:hypothetical protein